MLLLVTAIALAQTQPTTTVATATVTLEIPGEWTQLNTTADSGQTYLKNNEGVVIAVAQNLKRAYPFYKKGMSDFEGVVAFYEWDAQWREENNFSTKLLKKNKKQTYVIWKYNDGKLDNIYLFGSANDHFINLLVYTDQWDEATITEFLVKTYETNK